MVGATFGCEIQFICAVLYLTEEEEYFYGAENPESAVLLHSIDMMLENGI